MGWFESTLNLFTFGYSNCHLVFEWLITKPNYYEMLANRFNNKDKSDYDNANKIVSSAYKIIYTA